MSSEIRGTGGAHRRPHRVLVVLGAVIVGVGTWLRWAPLGPDSLWLDDLWVIAPSQASSWGDAVDMLVTAPLFSLLVNAPLVVLGPSSLAAQAIPFLAGIAAPALALAVTRWMGWRWYASVVSAVVVAVAPEHIVHSTRVKQYTLEAAIGLVVVALAWRVVERRSSPWTLAAVAAGATLLSGSAGVFAGAVLAATLLVGRDGPARREIVGPLVAYGAFALGWWAIYLRTHVSEGLRDYWRDDFLTLEDGLGGYLADLGATLDRLTQGFLPVAPAWPWIVIAAVVVVLLRPRLAILLAAPVGAAIVLATVEAAPLGTGRTDIYLLPVAAVAIGAAFDSLGGRLRSVERPWLLPAGALLAGALLVGGVVVRDLRPEGYPAEDVRELVALAEAGRPSDGRIIVYPATRWAYAVYTDGGFEPVPAENETGFDVEITTPGVTVLEPHREEPERYVPELRHATTGVDEVVFVASHWRADITVIEDWFREGGWIEQQRLATDGGLLVHWTRPG